MEFQKEYENIVSECISSDRLKELTSLKSKLSKKTVALFGAAWIGDFVYDRLCSMGVKPICFIDNFASGVTPHGNGPILKPADFISQYSDFYIILTLDRAKEIVYQQLLELGVQEQQIIADAKLLITPLTLDSFDSHVEGYKWAYNFFTDSISKQIIIDRIRCYLLGSNVMRSDSPQYFEKNLFEFSDSEVFVDGGFFTGDTAEEFIRVTNGRYKKIYGFEPDQYVREKMNPNLNNEKIEIICAGLYSSTGTVSFATTEGSSAASGGNVIGEVENQSENVISIPTVSIDDFFADKPIELQPTFIKMDIEGSEMAALQGAIHTIQKHRPKLAICVYHKPEDIYELTKFIYDLCPSYKFTLRHYAHYFWETVLYAY